jgi:hypothetical protein
MRVRLLPVPFALAIVVACVGSDHFSGPGTTAGDPSQVGDAGRLPDGGLVDGGPGPVPTDGGCNTQILPPGSVFAKDSCVSPGAITNTTAAIISAGCADVTISMVDGFNCHGSLSTPANRFTGTCSSLPCTSPSLPGTLTCTQLNSTTCIIQVCADTTGVNCP